MNTAMRRAALCLTTAIGAAIASPSLAQEDATLDTVIVTARRTDERLQDVPISITVFNQQQINNRNIVSGADLTTYTPSLTANNRMGNNSTSYSIRGFTQEARTTASVAVYFADVVAPRGGAGGTQVGDGAGPGAFFDLQNLQVLKGPQGTLFGRNTTGGAVLLVPQKPTREFEGYVEGSVGNYDMKRLQAVVNIPLADTARLRLGFDTMERDGYIKNISGIGPSRFGDENFTSLRASFVADLTPELENYTIATFARAYNRGPIGKFTGCAPTFFPFGLLSCQEMARQANEGFYTVQNNFRIPRSVNEQFQLINTTTWHASDRLTVKNIMSFSRLKNDTRAQIFGADFILPTSLGPIPNTGPLAGARFGFAEIVSPPGFNTANQENFTEEFQLQGRNFDDRLSWVAGAYYEESNPVGPTGAQSPILMPCSDRDNFRCTDVIGALFQRPGTTSMNFVLGEVSFRNMGLYTQGTYDLTDQLKLTAGLRYTWDVTRATAQQVTYRFLTPNVPTGRCTLNQAGPVVTTYLQCSNTSEQRSDKPTWVLGLDYSPTPDVMLYGKYSRGYRQGAINFSAPPEFQSYGPEKVDTYEVGAKTSFRGAVSGSLNIAAFYNDFTNQQLAVSLASSTNAVTITQAVINGGKSRIYGVEVDGSISPFANFRIDGAYAYLNTKLKTLTPVTTPPGSPFDLISFGATPGSQLPYTPKHKASVTASYTIPLDEDVGRITLAATWSYSSSYLIQSGPFGRIKANTLTNLNADWVGIGGQPVDLSLFATNVFDKEYYFSVADLRTSGGFISSVMGAPRMYGMRLKYHFGR